MSLRNRLVLPLALFSLAVLAGCGSGTHSPVPPPTGSFSNTNFNGTYTFSVFGSDGNGTFAMAGSLAACGCSAGTISGGSVDFVDLGVVAPASTITSGSTYNISADGRGTAKLLITNTTASFSTQVDVDFVLTSSSHGLIIRFDGNGTGSGTIDLQPTAVTQSSIGNTPYAFSLSGTDFTQNENPLTSAGAFTLDGSGTITAGVQDYNYSFAPYPQLTLTGTVFVGSGTAPGTATLTASSFGTLSFDVYAISSSHLKLIESDGQGVTVGDVYSQPTAAIPSGNLVFTMAGFDTSGEAPFVVGGLISSDGTTISSGSEDISELGQVDGGSNPAVPISFGGTFASTGGGRTLATLSGFAGGTLFAAYPSSGGILLVEIDSGLNPGTTSGVAMAQSATSIAAQGYGLNLTGVDLSSEVELDEIAEFVATSSAMTGLIDVNDGGDTETSNLSGTYTVASSGAGAASFNSGLAGMFFYVADSSTALLISTDSDQTALGVFQTQSAPTALSNMAQQHLAMLRSVRPPHSAKKNSKPHFGKAN